jgi:hypothetical protein
MWGYRALKMLRPGDTIIYRIWSGSDAVKIGRVISSTRDTEEMLLPGGGIIITVCEYRIHSDNSITYKGGPTYQYYVRQSNVIRKVKVIYQPLCSIHYTGYYTSSSNADWSWYYPITATSNSPLDWRYVSCGSTSD